MKKETWKTIVQIIVTVLSTILGKHKDTKTQSFYFKGNHNFSFLI